jgi:hypothetical protein
MFFIQAFPRRSKVIQGNPRLFPEKKDCLFFYGHPKSPQINHRPLALAFWSAAAAAALSGTRLRPCLASRNAKKFHSPKRQILTMLFARFK